MYTLIEIERGGKILLVKVNLLSYDGKTLVTDDEGMDVKTRKYHKLFGKEVEKAGVKFLKALKK